MFNNREQLSMSERNSISTWPVKYSEEQACLYNVMNIQKEIGNTGIF